MALTIGNLIVSNGGNKRRVTGTLDFDSSYPTGGEALTAANVALSVIDSIQVHPKSGYTFDYDYTNALVLAYRSAGFTPAGTVAAPVFTGAVPAFTGSALAAHTHALHFNNADVVDGTTTTVNVGTNLMGANTGTDIAVAGVVDTTGVGGIVQITGGTPAGTVGIGTGTNSAPAFTGTAVAAAVLVEVANATNLATLTGVRFEALGV